MRQYAFTPSESDPRAAGQTHWDEMRDELNATRQQLEHSDADRISQASLIDMLRRELAESKSAHDRDQVALVIMRTKLKAAGTLVLDALKDSEDHPEPKPRRRLQDLPPAPFKPLEPVAEHEEDDGAREIVSNIHALANKWP